MKKKKKQPKFIPKTGQVDYTNIRWAPVINCVVTYKGKILLVKRNGNLDLFPGYWNGISGFLDDKKSLKEKVYEELREELGIPKKALKSLRLGEIFHQDDPKNKKTWIVHPILVEVGTDKVKLDWEAEDFTLVSKKDIKKYRLMPGFDKVLKNVFPL